MVFLLVFRFARRCAMSEVRLVRLLEANGTAVADDRYALPPADVLLDRYRSLVLGRRLNEQASALVRQGRLAVYPSSYGQEACQVAAAAALRPETGCSPPTAMRSRSWSAAWTRSRR
jgi:TPP-dependent pyruvate/acetoin dehydrogenase alpha subunit